MRWKSILCEEDAHFTKLAHQLQLTPFAGRAGP